MWEYQNLKPTPRVLETQDRIFNCIHIKHVSLSEHTKPSTIGHFTCVLVDVDLLDYLHEEFLLKGKVSLFFIAITNFEVWCQQLNTLTLCLKHN